MKHLMMAVLLGFGVQASASNYPPDYPLHTDTATTGSTMVYRNVGVDWVAFHLMYNGPLVNHPQAASKLRVWVRLNGHEATFPLKYLGSPRGSAIYDVTVSRGAHSCFYSREINTYQCQKPTPEMLHVLYWAKPNAGSVNANAWDLQFAYYIDGTDVWDNNGTPGGSYPLHFESYGMY